MAVEAAAFSAGKTVIRNDIQLVPLHILSYMPARTGFPSPVPKILRTRPKPGPGRDGHSNRSLNNERVEVTNATLGTEGPSIVNALIIGS
ncbi:hypothetical protein Slala05_84350 [Streptomyces lavendulae subsp. lavendulae]|nr:hypothetical protein Slala05_84350 [Streptomyces lavendulae subsp. lavendulae]